MKLESDCANTSEKIGKLQEENVELKKLNETQTQHYEEKLNEGLQVHEKTEAEHNQLCELLKVQLNEKQAVVDGMVHNKSELCNKIDGLEKEEIDLNKKIEALEAVVKEWKSILQDLQDKFQIVSESDNSKSKEICDLNNQLEKLKSNEKGHIEDVNKYQNTIDNLKLENTKLKANVNKYQNTNDNLIQENTKLEANVNKYQKTNDNLIQENTKLEANVNKYQNSIDNLILENTKLEANVNMLIEDSKKVKEELLASNKEVERLKNELEAAARELRLISEVLDQKLDFVTNLVSHYNDIKHSLSLQELKENKTITEDKVLESCSINSNLMTENLNLKSSDMKNPEITNNDLLKENRKLKQELMELKELSEIQNIEFAKNITQLNESLNELQEERNNLSLVLQSIESQGKEINPESAKSTTNSVIKENKSSVLVEKHEMDIAELNNKVKSEIDALSSQTELVNQELKNLREQFNISQLTYSEKVAQLNYKLLLRTEKLVEVKNDLDASVQNAEELKILLDSMQEELKEKEELLRLSELQKQETEKVLKEKHIELELSLKQTHNSQLSALKEQTKATIEKLNKEIKKANDKLKESEIKFQSKLVSVEDKEMLNNKENSEHLLQCKDIVCNVLEKSATLENALKRLDVYGSLIINLNAKIHLILKKLQEKDNMIVNQQSQIDAFKKEVKFLTDESSDSQNLKIKFEEISGLLEKCKCELETAKSEKNLSEENLLNFKKSSDAEIKELKSVKDCLEKEKDSALKSASEFQSMYEKLILNYDQFTLKANGNMDNIALNIDKYESKLKSLQSNLCDVVVKLKSQINENCKLQIELKEISESNKSLLKFKESHNITENQLKQDLEQKIENLNEAEKTYKKEVQHLQKNLDDALSKLKVTEENNKTQSNEIQKLKSVLDCLEKGKDDALKSATEFKSMHEKIIFNLEQFTSKANINIETMTINIDNHESKLKYLKSHYGTVSSKLETQINENSQLKNDFEEISETNKRLLKEIESLIVSETQLKKDLNQKSTEAEKSFKKEIEGRQIELDEALSKLKVAEARNESQSNEIASLNNALKDAISNLKEMEKIVEKEKSKVLAEQNSIKDWENKCNSAVVAAKEASNSVTELEAKSQKLLVELKEKKALIDTMIPKEEMESFKNLNNEKINKMNSKIGELQHLVDSLTTEVTERKSIIKKIQNEKSNFETRSEESLKCLQDKLENAEKNYFTQMDEMKSRLSLLEKEKLALKTEKAELLKGQEKLTDLKNIESAIRAELKSKEEELKKIQQKHETTVKEQLAKIHGFQETMKDKENMILKLKANIETLNKDSSEKNDELKKKIKALEVEREQLMMQAQERVSITEAKYREDIKSLQEKNNKLLQENSEMEKLKLKIEHLVQEDRENCSRLEALKEEILLLKEKLSKAEERLSEAHNLKQSSEVELLGKLQVLQAENSSLLGKTNHFESLKAEKEELNEKLKDAEHQMTSIKELESERDKLKTENIDLVKQLDALKSNQEEDSSTREKFESLKENENALRIELDNLRSNKEDLEAKYSESNSLYETEVQALKLENEKLSKQIRMLEKFHTSEPESTSVKEYIATVRGECEAAIRAKDEELETKLKHLVRDFCIQMDVKDKDCDKMISEMIEKSQDAEDKLLREHRKEASELRQSLFEKECALDEMRDHYEERLQQKEKKIKELQLYTRKMADGDLGGGDVPPISEEGSDWDDTWAVPDESVENASQIEGLEPCKDHLQQIESLQEEVTKCNSEIKELKILLRLSPPESMVNNNNRRESLQAVPEPTEFEYLKNIIYEYMMGKEPITLVKVIAAVLRFSDTQTQQVIRREESKHPMR